MKPSTNWISQKQVGGDTWVLIRHTRSDGTVFHQVVELNGRGGDFPVRYPHTGRVVYDHPELLPKVVRSWVAGVMKGQ